MIICLSNQVSLQLDHTSLIIVKVNFLTERRSIHLIADFTVLEVVKEFEAATGQKVAYNIVDRRVGDVPSTYSTATLVEKELGWKANLTMKDMCKISEFYD